MLLSWHIILKYELIIDNHHQPSPQFDVELAVEDMVNPFQQSRGRGVEEALQFTVDMGVRSIENFDI